MKWSTETKIRAGVVAALLVLFVNAFVSYRATQQLIEHERLVTHTYQVLNELEATLSTMKDAETGERGFVITHEEPYLAPYERAVREIHLHVANLRRLTADNPRQQRRLPQLEQKIEARLARLQMGIEAIRSGNTGEARRLASSGVGKRLMDDLRQFVAVMTGEERDLLRRRADDARASVRDARITFVVSNVAACVLALLVGWVVLRGVAARRKANETLHHQREWLRVTLSSIGDGVIATDTEGSITFLNPVAEALTGWNAADAEGRPITEVFDIINETTRKPVDNPALHAIREGLTVGLANHTELVARNGRHVPIDDSGAPIRDTAGNVLGAVLIFRDVTERRRTEQEHEGVLVRERAAREAAEAANRAKDEFVAMISHEIRSPLTAVLGWAQMLLLGTLDKAESTRAVETIIHNARAQAKLIEDLMDISRVITGKLRLNARPVDPVPIVDDAIDAIRPAANAKSIRLDVYRATLHSLISADPDRLQQTVYNLLTNAVRFTPQGGRIEVRVEQAEGEIRIAVSDSGIGIEKDFLPHVFDRFAQASTSSERKFTGLGLGLAIVRHLVELHGGTVRVDSDGAGKGATFTVALPVVGELERLPIVQADRVADPHILTGLRVIVVDDESDTRELITALLTQRGAEVRAFGSAAAALEAIAGWPPSVVVSDIAMPHEDGYAFMRQLRIRGPEQGGSTPAVALTAFARSEDRVRALASGFQMHVPKPVEAPELIATVARLAGRL